MKIEPITSRIGARISGIDVSKPLEPAMIAAIKDALDGHSVLFFVDQAKLGGEEQLRFAKQFGEIEIPPKLTKQSVLREVLILEFTQPVGGGTDVWHTDASYLEKPPMAGILQAQILPAAGGDTCFSSMYAAYDALSFPMKTLLEGLTARHSTARILEVTRARGNYSYDSEQDRQAPRSHPIVTVNPLSGRRRLFVNSNYTVGIDGLTQAESDHLLKFLFDHIKSPEFQLRYHWSVGDIAFWDNHAVQHYAVADYTARRVMQRVTLAGYKPSGVGSGLHQAA